MGEHAAFTQTDRRVRFVLAYVGGWGGRTLRIACVMTWSAPPPDLKTASISSACGCSSASVSVDAVDINIHIYLYIQVPKTARTHLPTGAGVRLDDLHLPLDLVLDEGLVLRVHAHIHVHACGWMDEQTRRTTDDLSPALPTPLIPAPPPPPSPCSARSGSPSWSPQTCASACWSGCPVSAAGSGSPASRTGAWSCRPASSARAKGERVVII